jgi:hypothetical protein
MAVQCKRICKIPHKKTLFDTAAHFRGCTNTGQAIFRGENRDFFNKVKDLAHLLKMHLKALFRPE